MTKGKSVRGHHFGITGRASIILISQGLWRGKGRRCKASNASLSMCTVSYSGVHLTHLINEIVKTASILWSYAMMASRVTPTAEEEGAKVEGVKEEGGTGEAVGSSVTPRGRFSWNWVSLCWIEPALMAPMVVKKGEEGMKMEKHWRIRMIAEGRMSLSWVAVSWYKSRIDVMKWEGKSIERSFIKERRKRAWGSVMEL